MSFENIMSISGAAMDAQTAVINLAAFNVANADTVDTTADKAFKAKRRFRNCSPRRTLSWQNVSCG